MSDNAKDKAMFEARDKADSVSIDRVQAIAGELFDDYVVMARSKNGGFIQRYSDETWALGAHVRALAISDEILRESFRDRSV